MSMQSSTESYASPASGAPSSGTAALVLCALALGALPQRVLAQAQAEAWVPGKGNGSFSLALGRLVVHDHLDYRGDPFKAGGITDRILFTNLEYGVTDRLAVSIGIPYIQKKYEGTSPHRPQTLVDEDHHVAQIDDGDYHGGWQDFSFKLRYNVKAEPVSITPFVAVNVPSHEYIFFAHSALGTYQKSVALGIDIGRRFEPPWQDFYVQGGYSYAFVEEVRDINVDRSTLNLELGWLAHPGLVTKLLVNAQKTHGGLNLPIDFPFPRTGDVFYHHDQTQRIDFVVLGVGIDYQWNDRWTITSGYGKTIWGENGHEIHHSVTVGLSRSF